uniref:Uncharacterized protein n=1 Tax=Lotharella globosa TaxID=91324 RepID=A0A7S4DVY6_9EUKA
MTAEIIKGPAKFPIIHSVTPRLQTSTDSLYALLETISCVVNILSSMDDFSLAKAKPLRLIVTSLFMIPKGFKSDFTVDYALSVNMDLPPPTLRNVPACLVFRLIDFVQLERRFC